LKKSFEGILWLKLTHKQDKFTLIPCVCYLPPENSSRVFDVHAFFDNLLTDYYSFYKDGLVFICGDFNSRCGDLEDFIAGIDNIPLRIPRDFKANYYGELFIEFLINCNMCMLNGRFSTDHDNFTSVSSKGASVVDYCVVPHSDLYLCQNFKVLPVTNLINAIPGLNQCATSGLPDHNMITWNISTGELNMDNIETCNSIEHGSIKFDLHSIPYSFLSSAHTVQLINGTIDKIEQGLQQQSDIDTIYDDFCDIVKDDMHTFIPFKYVSYESSKRHRPRKPWWNMDLSALWSEMSTAEHKWLKCFDKSGREKLKTIYVNLRKQFDRQVQKAKRTHWYHIQTEILNECSVDQSKFWKSIGIFIIGVNSKARTQIPMEIVNSDGSKSTCTNEVLNRWKADFSGIFNDANLSNPGSNETHSNLTTSSDTAVPLFDNNLSILEVKKAVDGAKRGKACGFDNLPSEVLKNDVAIAFLHVLFNVCFNKGLVPTMWGKCIINPIPKASMPDARDPLAYRGIALASSIYKVYCSILNERLSSWAESNDKITDEQNGFRKKRSTTDHISSLTSFIDTRKKLGKSTVCAFIDFTKAYDSINRNTLWQRLSDIGIAGKLLNSVKSLYSSVFSCVRVNNLHTDWFEVKCGLRQGCILSPLLFNFISMTSHCI